MAETMNLKEGMQVYDAANQTYGTIERVSGNQFYVQGKTFQLSSVARVDGDKVYLSGSKSMNTLDQGDMVIPIVEEELQVGKREVQTGGVRVTNVVTEKPVEAEISLRDETVRVERRPVSRAATEADFAAVKDGVFEVIETDEEAVVSKQARVIEEVVINKEVHQTTQTIQDTVRRTDVQVENLPAQAQTASTATTTTITGQPVSETTDYDTDYRQNFQTTYAGTGSTYEQYQPAYQYGSTLANDPRYQGKDWSAVEKDVQKDWDQKDPGTWDQFKDSIHYSWDKATGRAW